MATKQQRTQVRQSASTAVVVRLLAFLVAIIGLAAMPATVIATTTGHMTHAAALSAFGIAVALIALAALAVRPFDPLRR